jgi:lipopolysaccharide/colanic/teichoic acid biosynthesis glycosyltransferase
VAATLLLLLLSPVLAVAAIAVKCSGPGPIFFRQTRVGRGGKPFEILKFRTMRTTPSPGPLITGAGDPRVTRVGRVLRRWKIDELPQLVNVLRGEMSFVGPRPEVPRYVDMFAEQYRELLAVRPGITDLASMAFREEETLLGRSANPEDVYVREILPRKLALSHAYVRRRSFGLDLRLIARTVAAILGWPRTGEETT